MGDAAFDAAYGEGAAMTLAEATAYALAVEHPDLTHALVRLLASPTGPTRTCRRWPSSRVWRTIS